MTDCLKTFGPRVNTFPVIAGFYTAFRHWFHVGGKLWLQSIQVHVRGCCQTFAHCHLKWLCFSVRIWADALLLDMSLTEICCPFNLLAHWPVGHLQACLDASLADLVGESKFWAVTSIFKWCKNWICMNFERRCYRPKYCSSLGPLFQSFIGLWVKLRHKNNLISCRAADLSQGHVQEKGICSDSDWKAQPLW